MILRPLLALKVLDLKRLSYINTLKEIEMAFPHLLKEIVHFLSVYKDLEGKKVETGKWHDADAAKAEITRTMQMYKDNK